MTEPREMEMAREVNAELTKQLAKLRDTERRQKVNLICRMAGNMLSSCASTADAVEYAIDIYNEVNNRI